MSERSAPAPVDPITHQARLEAVLESISDAFYALDADWRFVVFNKAAEDYFGMAAEAILGRELWEVFPQGRGSPFEWACNAAMHDGATSQFEAPSALRPDRFLAVRIAPMRGGGIALSLTDITDRRRVEDELKAALARSEAILESITDAFYAVDPEWRFSYVNSVAERWWGAGRAQLLGRVIWKEITGLGGAFRDVHMKAAATREVTRADAFVPALDRWIEISIFPSGRGLSVYLRDISERKRAEERQRLLVNELNHRVKNTLATVQAIANQSLRDAPGDYRQRFVARLMALGEANDLLIEEDWSGVTLRSIAELVARPHGGVASGRFVIVGDALATPAKAATTLALALHELATNAAKYGALSSPGGQVELSWAAGEEFLLVWRESGGPPVTRPDRCGFGTRLIERGLAVELKAQVRMDYQPEGLVCEVRAPMTALSA